MKPKKKIKKLKKISIKRVILWSILTLFVVSLLWIAVNATNTVLEVTQRDNVSVQLEDSNAGILYQKFNNL